MGYGQEEDERHQTHNADYLKATVKETWASNHLSMPQTESPLHATLNWGSIKAKGAPTKYLSTYTVNEHTFQKATIH